MSLRRGTGPVDMGAGAVEKDAGEMVGDQAGGGRQERLEGVDQLGCGLELACGFVAQPLADVGVEQLDGSLSHLFDGPVMRCGQGEQVRQGNTPSQQGQSGPGGLDVVFGVARPVADPLGNEEAFGGHGVEDRGGDAGSLGKLGEREQGAGGRPGGASTSSRRVTGVPAALTPFDQGMHQGFVGGVQGAVENAGDGGQAEPSSLQRPDPVQSSEMLA